MATISIEFQTIFASDLRRVLNFTRLGAGYLNLPRGEKKEETRFPCN